MLKLIVMPLDCRRVWVSITSGLLGTENKAVGGRTGGIGRMSSAALLPSRDTDAAVVSLDI